MGAAVGRPVARCTAGGRLAARSRAARCASSPGGGLPSLARKLASAEPNAPVVPLPGDLVRRALAVLRGARRLQVVPSGAPLGRAVGDGRARRVEPKRGCQERSVGPVSGRVVPGGHPTCSRRRGIWTAPKRSRTSDTSSPPTATRRWRSFARVGVARGFESALAPRSHDRTATPRPPDCRQLGGGRQRGRVEIVSGACNWGTARLPTVSGAEIRSPSRWSETEALRRSGPPALRALAPVRG